MWLLPSDVISNLYFLCFNNKNVIPATKGTWKNIWDELIHKRGQSLENGQEGSKGELPMYINSTHFPKFSIGI
jgi:hypothetical protein